VSEGPLTKARAHLVNRRTLGEMGRRFNIGEYLIVSRGEELHGGRSRSSALADAFEALIGAIYLDGGIEAASEFVLRCFQEALGEPTVIPNLENPKGELQELLQSQSVQSPVYHVVSASGPDHDRIFECIVTHQDRDLGRGTGKSKKAAETEAAFAALAKLREEQQAEESRDASAQAEPTQMEASENKPGMPG
jgi:ribonuclease III